jgi:hypothetical protein
VGDESGLLLIGYIHFNGADAAFPQFGVASRNTSVFRAGAGVYTIRVGPPALTGAGTPALGATSKWQRTVGQVLPKVTLGDDTVPANNGRIHSLTQIDLQTYTLLTFDDGGQGPSDSRVWFGLFQLRP